MNEKETFISEIELMDGRRIACFPSDEPEEAIDNTLRLDTTGTYLTVGKQPHAREEALDQRQDELKLFLDNAFLFVVNRERILSDSRMFLCPVPVQSGLAYTGTSGFARPTLGVYLEWWLHCPAANVRDGSDEPWLVYRLAGSPLSGMNHCSLVNTRGESKCEPQPSFIALWPKFQEINCRYDEAKASCRAYTLREVVDILEREGWNAVCGKDVTIYFLERAIQGLEMKLERARKQADEICKKWHHTLMVGKKAELKKFVKEYNSKKEAAERRCAEIQQERIALRKRMRSGEITPKEYQKAWTPLHKERDRLRFEVSDLLYNKLGNMFPEAYIPLWEIDNFLNTKSKYNE